MEKLLQVTYLYDFYGQLLTDKQEMAFRRYYLEDLSLGEIAKEEDVSRQSIHDMIKQAEKKLTSYEEKLGLIKRFKDQEKELQMIIEKLTAITPGQEDPETSLVISDVIKSTRKLLSD